MPLRAPLLIVITSACTLGSKFPELEQMMAVSAAVQNMQLVAHESWGLLNAVAYLDSHGL